LKCQIKNALAVLHYYNNKKINNIVIQVVCDVKKFFLNVCAEQLGGIRDVG
jgi:hypothetical protein